MKKIAYLILCACFVLLAGCSKSEHDGPADRTVLVYIAGANDLSPYADNNLRDMVEGYKSVAGKKGNLIVYFDNGNGVPRLIRINQSGQKTLKEYPGVNSTSDTNLSSVISYVLAEFPANSYGLILWSHSTGWTPAGFSLAAKTLARSAIYPPTRTFGHQYFDSKIYQIEIPDLARAIPSGVFDFLITDACLMGGVEALYPLRDKAAYIVTYPTEVIADGLPYAMITPDLMSSASAETLCRNICTKFFTHYNSLNGPYRSASVTLVKTSGLEPLSRAVGVVLKSNGAIIASLPLKNIQHYDLYSRPYMYDLDDFMKQAALPVQYDAFKSALDNTVLYQAHTDYFFDLKLERCCGLSAYIPSDTYGAYNSYYYSTEWYKACIR